MDFKTFIDRFQIRLNEQQRRAVQETEGPVLLLAVPGSGKTTVLVTRLGYMIHCCGIKHENILTLTYTVAAAGDMRERFNKIFGEEQGEKLEFRTINSICAGIISFYGSMIGKKAYALMGNEGDALRLISRIYQKTEGKYSVESELKDIKAKITYIKNMMMSEEEIKSLDEESEVHLADIYREYCSEMKKQRKMDFDDQMVYAYNLLRADERLLRHFQNKYRYICVDEAQDTSKIQHRIISLLASENDNLFMVGDEDQSIYGFRAAYPDALLNFEKEHSGSKVLLMEENYRSNANIVDAADGFIRKNVLRHEKHMRAVRGAGSEVREIVSPSRKAQYSYVMKIAENCMKQTAVLYRNNESAVPLVDMLERGGIPYRIRNAEISFFTNRVVIDIQNILRFAADMNAADLFEQIYFKLTTYLTKYEALRLCEASRRNGTSVFDEMVFEDTLKPYVRKSLKTIRTHFINMAGQRPLAAINRVVRYMGYGEYMKKAGISDAKLDIMKIIASKEDTIEGFLDRMSELKDIIRNGKNDENCPFILSTIHSSKGLEYDNVYMIDVVDGVFPEAVPVDPADLTDDELQIYEEERRLFYVGATRAKDNLNVFSIKGSSSLCMQFMNRKAENGRAGENYRKPEKKFSEAEYRDYINGLSEGLLVSHKVFGEGVIIAMDDDWADIMFGEEVKRLNLYIVFRNEIMKEL